MSDSFGIREVRFGDKLASLYFGSNVIWDRQGPGEPPPDPDPDPDPGVDWGNGWDGYGSSNTGFIGAPVTGSKFSVNYRGYSSPPAYVEWGSGAALGQPMTVWREINQGEPVWNCGKSNLSGYSLPSGCTAVHLEWYQHLKANHETGNGKRFGFQPFPNAAGGGVVAGEPDTTTSGLNLPGGWSIRYLQSRRWFSYGPSVNRHGLYVYCQNRSRDFNAPGGGGDRNFGATFLSPEFSAITDEWVRMNLTIILNTTGEANGRAMLWQNDVPMIDQGGIMWQEQIDNYPIQNFFWSHMWGGVAEDIIPSATFREHYNRFSIGATDRASALATPFPR